MKNFGITEALESLGIKKNNPGVSTGMTWLRSKGVRIESVSPVDGRSVGSVQAADEKTYRRVVDQSWEAFKSWRKWPAPKRGEVVRQIGEALRHHKEALA